MSTKHFNYFDDYKTQVLECPNCHWKGVFEQGSVEYYTDLMDCTCPECDVFVSPMLAIVLYPTLEEARANADRPGIREWVQRIDTGFDLFESQKLRGPEQLPEINADSFTLGWDFESDHADHGSRTLIMHKEIAIFSEPARFEEYPRFGEVAEILKQKYGDRINDLVPTKRSEPWLYGNASDGEASVDWFRVHFFGANVSKPIREPESDSTALDAIRELIARDDEQAEPKLPAEVNHEPSNDPPPQPAPTPRPRVMRPVPGVPGAYWERKETDTRLVMVPDPAWDKLSPEEQQSITSRMLTCCALDHHMFRVTALRDEFTKIAGEEKA